MSSNERLKLEVSTDEVARSVKSRPKSELFSLGDQIVLRKGHDNCETSPPTMGAVPKSALAVLNEVTVLVLS